MSGFPESGTDSVGLSNSALSDFSVPVQAISSKRSSNSSLSLALEPELLRAVPLDICLSGWGQHWSSTTEVASLARAHSLSRTVESIDFFLSHASHLHMGCSIDLEDWQTPRWMKAITMLVVFNSRAAFVSCWLASILTCILRVTRVLPNELWTACFGHITYVLVLCFWQRIRTCFGQGQMVFLDRLCINQTDLEVKQKGILGLGAFVVRSKKMLVLWSARYFTRLWCTYEIGCFLGRGGRINDIEILPVQGSVILLLTATLWHTLMTGYYVTMRLVSGDITSGSLFGLLIPAIVMCSLASLLLPVVNYLGMSMMKEVNQLPRQVANFEIRSAQCFCCSNCHRDPQTGMEMICDRELVYESLTTLYSGKLGKKNSLDEFNFRVQDRLGSKVLRKLGVGFPLKYVVYLIMASNVPFLGELIFVLQQGPLVQLDGADQMIWTVREILRWVQPLLAMLFAQKLSVWIWKVFNFRSSLSVSICLSPVICLGVASTWISMEVSLWLTSSNNMLPLLPFLVVLALDIFLYADVFKLHLRRSVSESNGDSLPSSDARERCEKDTWMKNQQQAEPLDPSMASVVLNSMNMTVCDRWEVEEDGDTLVTCKF